MSLCVQLQLANIPVLIVGGGKVALRKCLQLKREGARVTVLAEQFDESFETENICCIQDRYRKEYLQGHMLVIACGKDAAFNHSICEDARACGIFAMSVQRSVKASMHAMAYIEHEEYMLGFSSKGASPTLAKHIVHDLDAHVQQCCVQRLSLLRSIRTYALANMEKESRRTLFRMLPSFPLPDLIAADKALQKRELLLFCFHGTRLDASDELQHFLEIMQEHWTDKALGIAYLCETITKQSEQIGIADWLKAAELMRVSVTLVPMLFQDGNYYRMLCRYHSDTVRILPILFRNAAVMEECLNQICHAGGCSCLLVIYHSSKDGGFSDVMHTIMKQNSHIFAVHETYDKDTALPFYHRTVGVLPLYMLKGIHYRRDNHMNTTIAERLRQQYCTVSILDASCIEQKPFQTLMVKQIQDDLERK